jgi:Protein of unknown function (DUF3309)
MNLLLIIIIILLLGGGGIGYYGHGAGWNMGYYGGGLGTVVVILLVLALCGVI